MPPNGLQNGNPASSSSMPPGDNDSAPSIYNASTLASIRASLSTLHTQDKSVTTRLQSLISSQASLSRELGRLDLLRAHLGTQVLHTREISNGMLDNAATTAEHLSSKVKQLDLEKKRVEETLGVVEQVAELKACVQGVVGSMGAPQDWEAAAGYIARASKVPRHIVEGRFAATIVPSVEVPDPPVTTIENAKESLCGLFLREFEKAAEEGDGGKVTRFFKLFPLIGREDTGLDVYGRYVCQGVAQRARANLNQGTKGQAGKDGFFYANALTKLFEHIAQIVEGHGGLVERHYGKGKMVKVIERLQVEADVQGGIVLDMWGDERSVDRRLTDVKSYPFSFLVQSFLPPQRNQGILRTSSPAVGGAEAGRVSEDEGVDMKEVDGLLSETAVMLGRWSLYSRFLGGKCRDPSADAEEPLLMPDLLTKSALQRKVSTRLISPFNLMTTFFFRRSVEKAFQLDESPTGLSLNPARPLDGNPPYIISAVDDVMYIVNTVIQRSLSTSQRDVIAYVLPTISRVLGSDFVGMIQRKMRDESYPKPVIQGGFPPEEKIIAFLLLINSLDVANDYISRIVTSRLSPPPAASGAGGAPQTPEDLFPFSHDAKFVSTALQNLNASFASKSSELIADGLNVMFNQVIKPRLRPILADTFRDADYSLTTAAHESFLSSLLLSQDSDADVSSLASLVSDRFSHSWDQLVIPLRRLMTAKTFNMLLEQTARYLSKVLEKRVWGWKISGEGAGRLERDLSGIVNVVGRGGRWEVREAFARVSEMGGLVSMEEEEWGLLVEEEEEEEEQGGGGGVEGKEGMKWALSKEERRRVRGLVKG